MTDLPTLRETWAYRYGPGGLREQKRLVTDRVDDRTPCGVAPWTHYVRSPGGDPLVVYHGRQTSENPCSVEGLGFYDRRVHIYAYEYRVYGPVWRRVHHEMFGATAWWNVVNWTRVEKNL